MTLLIRTPVDHLVFHAPLASNLNDLMGGKGVGTHARNSSATYVNATTGLVTTVATNIPRYETVGSLAAILLEKESTNLIPYSHEFDNAAWTKTRSTVTADATTAPDGNAMADKLVEDATPADNHYISDSINKTSFTDDASVTFTLYAKQVERTWVRLLIFTKAGNFRNGYFNLATGAVGSKTATTSSIESAANGFYRCSITHDIENGANNPLFRIDIAEADGDVIIDGDGSSGIYIWGAQAEEAPIPSSYIATSGAAASRATESGYPLWTLPSGLFDDTFTAIMWARFGFAEADVSTDGGILACKDATASLIYHDISGNGIATHDGTTEITKALAFAKDTWYKFALKAESGGNFNIGYDSGSGISWGTAAGFDGDFNAGGAGLQLARALQGPMHIRDPRLYNYILTDAEINALGSP